MYVRYQTHDCDDECITHIHTHTHTHTYIHATQEEEATNKPGPGAYNSKSTLSGVYAYKRVCTHIDGCIDT